MKRTDDIDIWRFHARLTALEAAFQAWLEKHPEVTYNQLKDIREDLSEFLGFINDHFRDNVPKKENVDEETKQRVGSRVSTTQE